jgi:hypothetical protein
MTKHKNRISVPVQLFVIRTSSLFRHSSFVLRHLDDNERMRAKKLIAQASGCVTLSLWVRSLACARDDGSVAYADGDRVLDMCLGFGFWDLELLRGA